MFTGLRHTTLVYELEIHKGSQSVLSMPTVVFARTHEGTPTRMAHLTTASGRDLISIVCHSTRFASTASLIRFSSFVNRDLPVLISMNLMLISPSTSKPLKPIKSMGLPRIAVPSHC